MAGRADGTLNLSEDFHVLLQKVQLNWDKFQSPYSSVMLMETAEIHKPAHVMSG